MDDSIRESLITKCQQLSEGWNARALNVLAWLTKDVEGRLLPLINGATDVRRTPNCGPQTLILIEEMLTRLRPYYDRLMQMDGSDESDDSLLYVQLGTPQFRFSTYSYHMERRIQSTFEKMVDSVCNARAKRLIRKHFKQYRDTEPYLNDATPIWKWYGTGQQTMEAIQQFLTDFRTAYQDIIGKWGKDNDDGLAADTTMSPPDLDYPFLTKSEQEFVSSFWKKERRYPVFYIALRYLQRATDCPTHTFARVSGIMGQYESMQELAAEYNLSLERTRQLSKLTIDGTLPVWDLERWAALDFFHSSVLTEANTHWSALQKLEHIEEMSFYSALAILAPLCQMEVIALRADGYKANARRGKEVAWEEPHVLFAYDESLSSFALNAFLRTTGHEAMLQRITDKTTSLRAFAEPYFQPDADEESREQVLANLREILPMFPGVEVRQDDVTFRQNHLNYPEEIYQILCQQGRAMTVEDIYVEFRKRHPADHHTDSGFLRSYMRQDERFEAIGRKSTYQLRAWERFAGSLQELAIHLVQDEAEPQPTPKLVERMTAQRSNTTAKSCESTIYQTVAAGTLQYYFTAEDNDYSAYVGLPDKVYPSRFWVSPMSVEGAVAGMHRFISERGHWPYSSCSDNIEARLNYTLRKYTQRKHVTDEERDSFRQGMSDIPPHQYPRTERDALFMERCHALNAFWQQLHRLPDNDEEPTLAKWYRQTQANQQQLDDFRSNHFERIGQQPPAKPHRQLSFDFGEE